MIRLLGAPEIMVDGEPLRVDTRKAVAMIAYLALNPGAQTRDTLATLLWPELNQSRARAALRRTLSVLNHSDIGPWLAIERASIGLRAGPAVEIDVVTFHRLIAQCGEHGHVPDADCPRCIKPLSEAVTLYRDDFMRGFTLRDSVNFDDWQFFTAEELRRDFVQALDRLVEALARDGQFEVAIRQARRRLQSDSLHEAAHRQLMRLYVWSEQRNAALRQYRECVRILDEELGVPPLDETTTLYEEIYSNRPIPRPPPASADGPHARARLGAGARGQQSVGSTALVGREAAWSVLEGALSNAHDGHLVVVEGEAGIGKTALVDRFLASAAGRGYMTLNAQCYDGESELAYAPIRGLLRDGVLHTDAAERLAALPAQWLAEVGRLAPELASSSPGSVLQPVHDGPAAKGRFFEAISQVLGALAAGPLPLCIAIDNVHWADNATLELLGYVARRLRHRPICLILAWRTEKFAGDEPRRMIGYDAIRGVGKSEILLERLATRHVEQLLAGSDLAHASRSDFAADNLADRLMAVSAGIPLFLIEYMELLNQSPALIDEADWALPGGIRSLLQSRLGPISDAGRQLLAAAAVIGRAFDYDILRAVSGRSDDECILALEELLAHRLVRELDGSDYDFHHDQLRGLIYEEVSRARRRLLHRRVADALVTSARRESGARRSRAATLAYHYAQGDQIDQAITAYIEAAEQAVSVYANREAIRHFESALALGADEVAAIHERLGDLHMLLGEYTRARNDYESAAARGDGEPPARLEGKLGDLHHRLGNLQLAERHFEVALDDEALEPPWRCRILAQWSLAVEQGGDHEHALRLAEESLAVSTQSGDPSALSEAYNVLSILARHVENAGEAVEHAQRSLSFAEQSHAPAARDAALNSLALAHAAAGDHRLAIELTEEALSASLARGDRHRAAALHNHLADYHHALGDSRAAEKQIKTAVQLFAEIGADGLDLNPEIWKLVEW